MLADAASVAQGKLYIHGGAITRVNVVVPTGVVNLAAAVRLIIEDNDQRAAGRPVAIVWLKPDGENLLPPLEGELAPEVPADVVVREAEEQGIIIVANFTLGFETYGTYRVVFHLDDEPVAERPLAVVPLPATSPTADRGGNE